MKILTDLDAAYRSLEVKHGFPDGMLANELPLFATQLLLRKDTSTLDRAKALEPLLRELIALLEKELRPEQRNMLSSRNNLATALQSPGKHAEAEAEHRAVLGTEHPDTLQSRFNLALCLQDLGRREEALEALEALEEMEEMEAAYAGCRKVLGDAHPNTVDTKKLVEELKAGE